MTGIPGTNYYKDDRLVEFKYFKAKEAEHMLALNDPRPEDVAQVRAYAKDTKLKFPIIISSNDRSSVLQVIYILKVKLSVFTPIQKISKHLSSLIAALTALGISSCVSLF